MMLTPEQFEALVQMISAMADSRVTAREYRGDLSGRNFVKAAYLRSDEMIEAASTLLVEQPAKEMPTIERRCTSKKSSEGSGSPQIPCDGHIIAGQVYGGCGEPCRWMMQKSGEGEPPW